MNFDRYREILSGSVRWAVASAPGGGPECGMSLKTEVGRRLQRGQTWAAKLDKEAMGRAGLHVHPATRQTRLCTGHRVKWYPLFFILAFGRRDSPAIALRREIT